MMPHEKILEGHEQRLLIDEPGSWICEFVVSGPTALVQSSRAALMRQLTRIPGGVLIHYDEDPVEDGVPGDWIAHGNHTWQAPPVINSIALLKWLRLGNWIAWSAAKREVPLIRFGKPMLGDLREAIRTSDFVLVSFHDDDPWILAWNKRCPETLLLTTDSLRDE